MGFTCQSFASVSLEPPLILFCADHRGRAWPRIRRSGRFTINVLREDQTDLCVRFGSSRGTKFDGLAWEPSRWSTPSLPGVLVRVHADVQSVHTAGDHDVVIGRVLELDSVCEERPMVFFRGGFGIDADVRGPCGNGSSDRQGRPGVRTSRRTAVVASIRSIAWGDQLRRRRPAYGELSADLRGPRPRPMFDVSDGKSSVVTSRAASTTSGATRSSGGARVADREIAGDRALRSADRGSHAGDLREALPSLEREAVALRGSA